MADSKSTPWLAVDFFGQFFRLNSDGDLEYQPMLQDGSMEPIGEDGPNVPDDFASDQIRKCDKILAAYLANPDAPENSIIKAFLANPAAFEGPAGDALPVVCDECNIHFGTQCEHF
jgi:hypothetical protein